MKQVSHRGYLLVEVPEDATDFYIVNYDGINIVYDVGHRRGFVDISTAINMRVEKTNTGNFLSEEYKTLVDFIPEIIGKGNEIKEQVCKGIVQYDIHPMEDYVIGYTDYDLDDDNVLLDTAKKSLDSLIKSHGMKPEQCLILKLINTNT